KVLGLAGDNVGINWGYLYLGTETMPGMSQGMYGSEASRKTFVTSGKLLDHDDTRKPRAASDDWPVLAVAWDLGKVYV
ncbi:DUF5127 domain-containing protein, partial [Escherichia coli]|nr:DUF5127 domain-containing protein [Escherichia coli]